MEVQVHGTTSPALNEHVNQQIMGALAPMLSRVDNVQVKLEDVNGRSKGENDKRCLVTVRIKHQDPVVIDESNGDMYNAVKKAAVRLKNVLGKKHDKLMEKMHGH